MLSEYLVRAAMDIPALMIRHMNAQALRNKSMSGLQQAGSKVVQKAYCKPHEGNVDPIRVSCKETLSTNLPS